MKIRTLLFLITVVITHPGLAQDTQPYAISEKVINEAESLSLGIE